MIGMTSNIKVAPLPDDWEAPVIHRTELLDGGRKIGLLIRNRDGSIEAIRVSVDEILAIG